MQSEETNTSIDVGMARRRLRMPFDLLRFLYIRRQGKNGFSVASVRVRQCEQDRLNELTVLG